MRGIVHLKTVMLLLGECACDLELCISFWLQGDMISLVYAIFLTVILAFSAVVQALSACFSTGEGPLTALVALTGLKVVVEARRALWEIAPGVSRRARESAARRALRDCAQTRATRRGGLRAASTISRMHRRRE